MYIALMYRGCVDPEPKILHNILNWSSTFSSFLLKIPLSSSEVPAIAAHTFLRRAITTGVLPGVSAGSVGWGQTRQAATRGRDVRGARG